MKSWENAKIEKINFSATAKNDKNNGNNDTHTHKGWCEMHKHPENGICTCGTSVKDLS